MDCAKQGCPSSSARLLKRAPTQHAVIKRGPLGAQVGLRSFGRPWGKNLTDLLRCRALLTWATTTEATLFDPAAFGACVAAAAGYSMGFDAAVRAQSISDAVRFLQRNLRP